MISVFDRMQQIRNMQKPQDNTMANMDRLSGALGQASQTIAGIGQQDAAMQAQQQDADWNSAWALANGLDASGQPLESTDPDFQKWQADPDRQRKYDAMAAYGASKGLIKPQAQAAPQKLSYQNVMKDGSLHRIGVDAQGREVTDLGRTQLPGNRDKAESAFDVAVAKQSVKDLGSINKSIEQNRNQSRKMAELEKSLKKIPEGSLLIGHGLAPMAVAAGKFATAMGMDIEGLGEAETIQALNNELAVGSRQPGSGTFTDMDMQVYKTINAGLQDTREGFMKKIKLKRSAMAYEDKFARMKQAYIRKHKSDDGFQEFAQEWQQKNPFQDTVKDLMGEPSIQMGPITTGALGDMSTADLEAELRALEGQ